MGRFFADSILGGILVEPEMAELWKSEAPDAADGPQGEETSDENGGLGGHRIGEGEPHTGKVPTGPVRIVVGKVMQGDISLDEARQLSDEIIRSLREDGGEIVVRIIIEADKDGGFSQQVDRDVRANSRDLGLDIDVSS